MYQVPEHWSKFLELAKSQQAKQKIPDFSITPSVLFETCLHKTHMVPKLLGKTHRVGIVNAISFCSESEESS